MQVTETLEAFRAHANRLPAIDTRLHPHDLQARAHAMTDACRCAAPIQLDLDPSQQQALQDLGMPGQSGVHILTGPPGSGKTLVLRSVIQQCAHRNLLVSATSASAAQTLLPGFADTVHAVFRIPTGRNLTQFDVTSTAGQLLSHGRVFVIDEFSMLNCQMFQWILNRVREAQELRTDHDVLSSNLFILCGDLCQLPCVCRARSCSARARSSGGICPVHHIILHPVVARAYLSTHGASTLRLHRLRVNHRNSGMAETLARICEGPLSEGDVDRLVNAGRVRSEAPRDAITLCSHRHLVRTNGPPLPAFAMSSHPLLFSNVTFRCSGATLQHRRLLTPVP